MPEIITQKYFFGGWKSVVIYSEQEMADALGLTHAGLHTAIEAGKLCYHAHPSSNALREYQFNQGAYNDNLDRWSCLRKYGAHQFEFDHYYDKRLGKAVYKCRFCPAERFD